MDEKVVKAEVGVSKADVKADKREAKADQKDLNEVKVDAAKQSPKPVQGKPQCVAFFYLMK